LLTLRHAGQSDDGNTHLRPADPVRQAARMRPLAGGTDLLPRMKLDLAGEGTRRAVHPSNLAPAHGP
jgi:hypothetical protein